MKVVNPNHQLCAELASQALLEPFGLRIKVDNAERFRQIFYAWRAKQGPDRRLSLALSPNNPRQEVFLIHTYPAEFQPSGKDNE
jgi:hypothetical protein